MCNKCRQLHRHDNNGIAECRGNERSAQKLNVKNVKCYCNRSHNKKTFQEDVYRPLANRTCFSGHHQMSLIGGVLKWIKFEQVSSVGQQLSVAGLMWGGYPPDFPRDTLPCDLSHDVSDAPTPPSPPPVNSRASSSYFFLFFSAYSYFSYFLAISSYFSYFLAILLTISKYLLEI